MHSDPDAFRIHAEEDPPKKSLRERTLANVLADEINSEWKNDLEELAHAHPPESLEPRATEILPMPSTREIVQCEYCDKRMSANGMGRHRAMHIRRLNAENKLGETPNDKIVARLKTRAQQRMKDCRDAIDQCCRRAADDEQLRLAHAALDRFHEFKDDLELLGFFG